MSNQYEVNITAEAGIEKVMSKFPEIASCIQAGVLFRPLLAEVPAIDFQGFKDRTPAQVEPVRKPRMKH